MCANKQIKKKRITHPMRIWKVRGCEGKESTVHMERRPHRGACPRSSPTLSPD